jgi:hypothetical protein
MTDEERRARLAEDKARHREALERAATPEPEPPVVERRTPPVVVERRTHDGTWGWSPPPMMAAEYADDEGMLTPWSRTMPKPKPEPEILPPQKADTLDEDHQKTRAALVEHKLIADARQNAIGQVFGLERARHRKQFEALLAKIAGLELRLDALTHEASKAKRLDAAERRDHARGEVLPLWGQYRA